MHIPDGFVDVPTSLGAGGLAVVGSACAVQRASATLEERQVPLAGLVAAFVFAAQLVNFPVLNGTSGHLVGAGLAVALVGPWVGATCVAVVVCVQALVLADGGLSAIGLNVVNLALVACLAAGVVIRAILAVAPRRPWSAPAAAGVGAGAGLLLAAAAFVVEYALGGTAPVPLGSLAASMMGVHAVIAVVEAVITAMTVSAVMATRPDLVWAARLGRDPASSVPGSRPVGIADAACAVDPAGARRDWAGSMDGVRGRDRGVDLGRGRG